ncbi:sensor histidine kinase [Nonomuraea spiralis]|uniref:sensor histidine kinase n=1 Tax=Nonomuraea spiralis TaxID=46182 RepID=UPI0037B1B25F
MTGEAAVRELEFGRGRAAARAGACAWLVLSVWPLWAFFSSRPGALAVVWAVAALAVFAACWLRIMWRMLGPRGAAGLRWPLVGLVAAGLALLPVLRDPWAYVGFVFVVSALTACLGRVVYTAAGVAGTIVVVVAALTTYGRPFEQVWWVPLVIVVEAVTVGSIKHLGELVARLDAARAHVARLAVDNERLRFARDLHDTLGHTLTSITIRSQLAARLARTDPERAAREMADVERAARQALDEVRHAVSGYRAPSLSGELRTAAHSLGLAGIGLEVSPAAGPVPAAAETLLAWTVREAATNVVRHSRARRCRIDLGVDDTAATVEIRDDGQGPGTPSGTPTGGPTGGNGLTGLAERIAAAGGRLEAGPLPGGGYRLHARVPLESP